MTKLAIRNRTGDNIIDIIRHENVHQNQLLSGQPMTRLEMEIGAYLYNMSNPSHPSLFWRFNFLLINELIYNLSW
jgi:hypothetical protein